MVDLRSYYDQRVRHFGSGQALAQVGHTVAGEPISEEAFSLLTDEVIELLELSEDDVLLDLGCGNGLITRRLADHCTDICAIDFSDAMINSARDINSADNIAYICANALDIIEEIVSGRRFSKVLMYGAVQHLDKDGLQSLLVQVLPLCQQEVCMVFGFIPDRAKRWDFYGSFRKRWNYLISRLLKRDIMGTWWFKEWVSHCCKQVNVSYRFVDVPHGRYGHPYRFHAVLKQQVEVGSG